jgi:hypothetical protein
LTKKHEKINESSSQHKKVQTETSTNICARGPLKAGVLFSLLFFAFSIFK